MKSAVLFLIFNRPETTSLVFGAIRAARPPKLYIAADGPRRDRVSELKRCQAARKIAQSVDWPCEVKTLFRDSNLGCKIGVSSGIDWFFQHEEEGIILEDDVLPQGSFFSFCDELLEKYRHDKNIWMISGSNLISKHTHRFKESYFASNVPLIWGWASWRRAWQHYDVTMVDWSKWKKTTAWKELFNRDWLAVSYWTDALNTVYGGRLNTWDYQWLYTCWRNGGRVILPRINLTDNLGYGAEATHTSAEKPQCLLDSSPQEMPFPLIEPKTLLPSSQIDRLIFKEVHGVSLVGYIRRLLRPLKFITKIKI
jgi:hypothetical protein